MISGGLTAMLDLTILGDTCFPVAMSSHFYSPLNLKVITPRLELRGATDDLLARLLPVVRADVAEG